MTADLQLAALIGKDFEQVFPGISARGCVLVGNTAR
jgi:hypothetical protein